MTQPLEIIIPIRNPGPILAQTIGTLLAQTDRRFCVLLSDNFSTTGLEYFDDAEKQLSGAGIPVRRVGPPRELKRVEHWNWAHAQAESEWLKPLFVGDLLSPAYVRRVLERVDAGTRTSLIRVELEWKTPTFTNTAPAPTAKTSLTPAEYLEFFPGFGNWLGSPASMAYRRTAWRATGGYAVHLAACADYNLYIRLALENGLEIIHDYLAVLQIHDQRFSHGVAKRKVNGFFELWLMLRQARNYCQNNGLPWPKNGMRRGLWKQWKVDYWQPWKAGVKRLLRRGK